MKKLLATLWTVETIPGILRHLIVGVVSGAIVIATTVWAASSEWQRYTTLVTSTSSALNSHIGSPGLHPTIESSMFQAERLARIEEQLKFTGKQVAETREDVKKLLERPR